ncbi:MAG: DUF6531 domain-containing protein, partial [Clostridiales Family XIII bacterium]|nr:DUF6531 domain-containing protein [Clostridiales Family XIII bacterium]
MRDTGMPAFLPRKGVALLTAAALALAILPIGGGAFAAKMPPGSDSIDLHSEVAEIRFRMDYTQYVNIAVYQNASDAAINNNQVAAPPLGFVTKLYEAKGAAPLAPHPYNPCILDGKHHHPGGDYGEPAYRKYTGPVPPFSPVFPYSAPTAPTAGPEGEGATPGGMGQPPEPAAKGIIEEAPIPLLYALETGAGEAGPGAGEARADSGPEAGGQAEAGGAADDAADDAADAATGGDAGGDKPAAAGDAAAGETADETTGPAPTGDADADPATGAALDGAEGGHEGDEPEYAPLTDRPLIEITSVRIVDRKELAGERGAGEMARDFSPLALPTDPTTPSAIWYDDTTGENVLYWDGRYNRNSGTGLAPDWLPAVPKSGGDDWAMPVISIEPVGYPWKNVNQSCFLAHHPGEAWEWTAQPKHYVSSGAIRLDLRGGSMLLAMAPGELGGEIQGFLDGYGNGLYAGVGPGAAQAPANGFEDLTLAKDGLGSVNMVTGACHFANDDLKIQGGWPLVWRRAYSSLDDNGSAGLGKGFSHIYDYRLLDDRGIIYVEGPYGELLLFMRYRTASGDAYRPLQDTGFTLESADRNSYRMAYRGGSALTLSGGRLTRMETMDGETIADLTYSGDMLASVSNRAGRLDVSWSGGHISSVTDGARTISYAYDGDSLVSYRNPDGDTLAYGYDADGLISSLADFNGDIRLENSYDGKGRVTGQSMHTAGGTATASVSYDDKARTNTATDFTGQSLVYVYDSDGLPLSIGDMDGERANTWGDEYRADSRSNDGKEGVSYTFDGDGNTTEASYQDGGLVRAIYSGGFLTQKLYKDGSTEGWTYSGGNIATYKDRNGNTTRYAYTDGLLTGETDGEGGTTAYAYSPEGFLTKISRPEGIATAMSHDAAGRVKTMTGPLGEVTSYAYSPAGKLLSESVTDGKQTFTKTYEHTKNGAVTKETDHRGNAETTVYGTMDLPLSRTDREGNTTTFTYTPFGAVSGETDFNGGVTSYAYDGKGRVESVTDAEGNVTEYAYSAQGRRASMTDPSGFTESYEYDLMGRLSKVTDRNGNVTENEYDADGRLVKETRKGDASTGGDAVSLYAYKPGGQLEKATDPEGNWASYTYDRRNLVKSVRDGEGRGKDYGYDGAGRLVSVKDTEGNATEYALDAAGNVTAIKDPRGNSARFAYDAFSRLVSEATPEGHETRYTHDGNGNTLSVTDPRGGVRAYAYDGLDRVASETDPLGYTTGYGYLGTYGASLVTYPDGLTEKTAYNSLGLVTGRTDRAGNQTLYAYDGRGQLSRATDAEGYVDEYAYDGGMRLIAHTRDGQLVAENAYDPLGRLSSRRDFKGTVRFEYFRTGDLKTHTDKNGNATAYAYDGSRLPASVTNADGGVAEYGHDLAGRLVYTKDPGGLETRLSLDGSGNVTGRDETDGQATTRERFAYDKDGKAVSHTDKNGNKTEYGYGPTGLPVLSETKGVPAPLVVKTEYAYDLGGNLTGVYDPLEKWVRYTYDFAGNALSEKDQLGHIEYYAYDAMHNLISVTDRGASGVRGVTKYFYDRLNRLTGEESPEGGTVSRSLDAFGGVTAERQLTAGGKWQSSLYERDPLGNPVKDTSPLGFKTLYETDAEGKLTKKTDADGNVSLFTYDSMNRPATAKYGTAGAIAYEYDFMGNVTRVTEDMGVTALSYDRWNRLTGTTDHDGRALAWEYDANGNRTALTYPDGKKAEYAYDHMDRVVGIVYGNETKLYQYDPKSQLIQETWPGTGEQTGYAYNEAGYLTEGKETDGDGVTRRQTNYSYRDNGLLWNETRTGIGVPRGEEILIHSYDRDGRLARTSVDGQERSAYAYDIAGNLISERTKGAKTTYAYDIQNRQTRKTAAGKTTDYAYDGRGNLVRESSAKGAKTYAYDAAGRLAAGTNERGETSEYAYNGLGARVFHKEVRDNMNVGHQNGGFRGGSWPG